MNDEGRNSKDEAKPLAVDQIIDYRSPKINPERRKELGPIETYVQYAFVAIFLLILAAAVW
jgi:hypothetical protein